MLNGDHVMNRTCFSSKSAQRGVALIEAMVAILLFSIGVLAVAGLQASMLRNTGDAKYRADAGYIAQQRIGVLWSDLSNIDALYLEDKTPISDLLPGVLRSVTKNATGEYVVTVGWTAPGETVNSGAGTICNSKLNMNVAHCYSVVAGISSYCRPGIDANCPL
jgi:type IV pilus assembly protein PilV